MRMTPARRYLLVAYVAGLTLALIAGEWFLEGPRLLRLRDGHGIHAGDLVVVVASTVVGLTLLGRDMRRGGRAAQRRRQPQEPHAPNRQGRP
jgi:hypothetical protein